MSTGRRRYRPRACVEVHAVGFGPLAARRLGSVLEPVVGQVYFSPECHAQLRGARLRCQRPRGRRRGAARRTGLLHEPRQRDGTGAGDVVAAAFAVFNPEVVVPFVELGWQRTDAATICAARTDGAVAQLRRILGDEPAGARPRQRAARPRRRTAAAGGPPVVRRRSASLGVPDEPLDRGVAAGRHAPRVPRRQPHVAWVSAGLDATEIGLLTELYWGLPMRTYAPHAGVDREQFDAAAERLRVPRPDRRRRVHRRRPRAPRGDRGRRPTSRCSRRSTRSATTSTSCARSSNHGAPRSEPARATSPAGPHDLAPPRRTHDDHHRRSSRRSRSPTFADGTGWDPEAAGPVPRRGLRARRPGRSRDDGTIDVARRRRPARHAARPRRRCTASGPSARVRRPVAR